MTLGTTASNKVPGYAFIQQKAQASIGASVFFPGFHLFLLVYIDIINSGMEVILKGHLIHSPCLKLS